MFRYNPAANYEPNGGRYLQILSGKDLYKQTIVVSAETHDAFPVRFPNIFVDYPLGQMHVGDKLWTNWNKAPMHLWQTQLNFALWCALSACRVSSAHLNYTKHPVIRSVYRFHVYYQVRRVLKKLQTPLPHKTCFNVADNLYTESEFFEICEDYRVPNDPMKYQDQKFYWTYQCGVHWPDDYIGPDSMTQWIIETSMGVTDVGLLRISESVRAYAYLILSSQASARSSIIGNSASSLTAPSAFLSNFENFVNCSVNIQEDIKHYQETLSYASSKVDYSIGENLFMLPSNMQLRIRSETIRYNNKILVSDGNFSLGKNENIHSLKTPAIETNSLETPAIKSHLNTARGLTHTPTIFQKNQKPKTIIHSNEKIALVLALAGDFFNMDYIQMKSQ